MRLSFWPIGSVIILVATACIIAPIGASPSEQYQKYLDDAFHAYDYGDYKKAIEMYRPLAEICQPDACAMMGLSYMYLGDRVRAYAWMGIAGKQYRAMHQSGGSRLTPEELEKLDGLGEGMHENIEGLKLTPEELEAANEIMHELKRRYCRD
jgi:hypothetical protein